MIIVIKLLLTIILSQRIVILLWHKNKFAIACCLVNVRKYTFLCLNHNFPPHSTHMTDKFIYDSTISHQYYIVKWNSNNMMRYSIRKIIESCCKKIKKSLWLSWYLQLWVFFFSYQFIEPIVSSFFKFLQI